MGLAKRFIDSTILIIDDQPANLAVLVDFLESKEMEEKLRCMAITDDLTGLYNRRGLMLLANKLLKKASRNKTRFYLLYTDLNDLKLINDQLGHKSGDQALVEIAKLMHESFRESDIISRIGGDEFVIVLEGEPPAESENTSNT